MALFDATRTIWGTKKPKAHFEKKMKEAELSMQYLKGIFELRAQGAKPAKYEAPGSALEAKRHYTNALNDYNYYKGLFENYDN